MEWKHIFKCKKMISYFTVLIKFSVSDTVVGTASVYMLWLQLMVFSIKDDLDTISNALSYMNELSAVLFS